MKKYLLLLAVAVLALGAFALNRRADAPAEAGMAPDAARVIGDDRPITRGQAARMIALTFMDEAQLAALPPVHPFTDLEPGHAHHRYINAVFSMEVMRGAGDRFMPDEPLTLGQAQILLDVLDPAGAPFLEASAEADRPVSYALWVDLYRRLLTELSAPYTAYEAFGITVQDLIVLEADGRRMVSDRGAFDYCGLGLGVEALADRQIRVLMKGRQIIALDAVLSDRPVLRGVYVQEADRDGLQVLAGGASRFYPFGSGFGRNNGAERGRIVRDSVGDLAVWQGEALAFTPHDGTLTGVLLRASESFIELKGLGRFPLEPDFQVYDVSGGAPVWRGQGASQLMLGADAARFYLRDGRVFAAVITCAELPADIRVVISTSHFAGPIHNRVTVTAEDAFWVTVGGPEAERLAEFAPHRHLTVSDLEHSDLWGHPRIFIHTDADALMLVGLGRSYPENTHPRYRGVIEIAREPEGFSVINALPLEAYLYAVIPSEMPSYFGAVPSEVQAVAARSFAVHQMQARLHHALGGHVVDSVYAQVYNNLPETDVAIAAAAATRGLVLMYAGRVIRANYFSTSAGHTANSGEVWAQGEAFPAYTPAYLRARPQMWGAEPGGTEPSLRGLADEAAASEFFRSIPSDAIEREVAWFRWHVEMTATEIAHRLDAHAQPVGSLRSLEVLRRGEGGNVMALRFVGDAGAADVLTEYRIRSVLRPEDIPIQRHDGSAALSRALLPSAFFTFDLIMDHYGDLERVRFYGGGHGHGAGMSQNGVRALADRGWDFREILLHYFPGVDVLPFSEYNLRVARR